jgi:hypothetical protein
MAGIGFPGRLMLGMMPCASSRSVYSRLAYCTPDLSGAPGLTAVVATRSPVLQSSLTRVHCAGFEPSTGDQFAYFESQARAQISHGRSSGDCKYFPGLAVYNALTASFDCALVVCRDGNGILTYFVLPGRPTEARIPGSSGAGLDHNGAGARATQENKRAFSIGLARVLSPPSVAPCLQRVSFFRPDNTHSSFGCRRL